MVDKSIEPTVPCSFTPFHSFVEFHRHPFRVCPRLLPGTMSRAFKISLILKSRNSLPVYKDLAKLSDVELDDQVRAIVRRMRANESGIIARMTLRQPTFSLN